MSHPTLLEPLKELQALRGGRALAYLVDRFTAADVYPLYECLRSVGPVERLDLVLDTGGGEIDLTRRIALLLREYAGELRVLVPDRAESAGTLLCLAADRLVLGPMARLSPLDPHITSLGEAGQGPNRISSEDIRAFPEMAEAWFGLDRTADRQAAFSAVSQRLFPATMSSFYRNDCNIRRAGRELLARQRPDLDEEGRGRVVDHLVSGYDSHGHAITRAEATELGLAVAQPSPEEEALMWDCVRLFRDVKHGESGGGERTHGLIASGDAFLARQVILGAGPDGKTPLSRWQVDSSAGGGR